MCAVRGGWGIVGLLGVSRNIGLLDAPGGVVNYLCGLSGPEVRRDTSGTSGCIEGPQARVRVPAPPDALPIATLLSRR